MIIAFLGMGPMEMMIIGVIAVILFGSKLPDVARSVGKSYREFRRGISDFQAQTHVPDYPTSDDTYSSSTTTTEEYDEYEEATAPKFSPPPTDSQEETVADSDEEASILEQRVKRDQQDAGVSEEAD